MSPKESMVAAAFELKLSEASQQMALPSTWRNFVRQYAAVQRAWLEVEAYLTMNTSLHPMKQRSTGQPYKLQARMSTFTTDPAIVQCLFIMGLPVWNVCKDTTVDKNFHIDRWLMHSELQQPRHVQEDLGNFKSLQPWVGMPGDGHLREIARRVYFMVDVERSVYIDGFRDVHQTTSTMASDSSALVDTNGHGPDRVNWQFARAKPCTSQLHFALFLSDAHGL